MESSDPLNMLAVYCTCPAAQSVAIIIKYVEEQLISNCVCLYMTVGQASDSMMAFV